MDVFTSKHQENTNLSGTAGYGGVISDEKGQWIKGYMGQIGYAAVLEAELWAIHRGLVIIYKDLMKDVSIETDSKEAIQCIKDPIPDNFPYKALVEDICTILKGCNCDISYIPRENNVLADALAKEGRMQLEIIVILENVPQSLQNLVIKDIILSE